MILNIDMVNPMQITSTHSDLLPCGRPKPRGHHHPSSKNPAYLKSLEDRIARFSAEHGLKNSRARAQVLTAIVDSLGARGAKRHASLVEIAHLVQASHPGIGVATVYRNVPLFVQAGILRETLIDNQGQRLFELSMTEHHDHIVCLDCHEILEFHDPSIEEAQEKITKKLRFTPSHHTHVIYARCGYLSSPKKRRR